MIQLIRYPRTGQTNDVEVTNIFGAREIDWGGP